MRPRKRKGEICSSDLGRRKQDEPWVDRYMPCSKVDLAVHKKKVEEVENWLKVHTDGSQGGLLLLTGPSGCGKTATIQVLSLELGLRIQEWTNPPKLDSYTNSQQDRTTNSLSSTSQSAQFQEFLLRANKYNCLKMVGDARSTGMNLILVEEFPNQFYRNPSGLHDILRCFVKTSRCPLVFIVSNSPSADSSSRFLFPRELIEELHISNISFNPVAPTTMMKVLTRILTTEDGKSIGTVIVPDQTVLEMVCSGSSGDIRSAINNLQFASVPDYPQQKEVLRGNHPLKSKVKAVSRSTLSKKSKPKNGQEGQPPVGMKDTCLFLFRALGKILHCKRGTPECVQEAECAFALQLPSHLSQHHRESLQVDPEWVIEHSYVSGEFFNLYLHQNYLDFFSEMDDVEKASEYMSDADLLTSDWMSSNTMRDYASSVATRGLLHSNSQQVAVGFRPLHKPNWLLVSKKHRENCLAAQFLFRHFCMTPVSLQTELLPYLAKFTNPFKNQEFRLMLMPDLHQAISLDDDLMTGDLGDGMTVKTTSLSTRKKSQSSTELRGRISPDGDVYRRSHAREAVCIPRLMTEGWEKMSTWKMPLIAGSFADMPKEELRDKLLESIEVIDVLICELEVAHRYLEGKFEALKILQGKAILEQATSHTKSLLQKSEERAKALEKVLCFLLPTD